MLFVIALVSVLNRHGLWVNIHHFQWRRRMQCGYMWTFSSDCTAWRLVENWDKEKMNFCRQKQTKHPKKKKLKSENWNGQKLLMEITCWIIHDHTLWHWLLKTKGVNARKTAAPKWKNHRPIFHCMSFGATRNISRNVGKMMPRK